MQLPFFFRAKITIAILEGKHVGNALKVMDVKV